MAERGERWRKGGVIGKVGQGGGAGVVWERKGLVVGCRHCAQGSGGGAPSPNRPNPTRPGRKIAFNIIPIPIPIPMPIHTPRGVAWRVRGRAGLDGWLGLWNDETCKVGKG